MKKRTGLYLIQAIDGFLLSCNARHLSPATISDYTRTLKRFHTFIGNPNVKDVSPGDISAFLASQPWKTKTIYNYHIGLSSLWTWLVREEFVERHIVRVVQRPKPQEVVVEPFNNTEVRALLSTAHGYLEERDRAIILILLDTGIRASELVSIQRDDIDLANRRIKVLGKGNKERFVPISPKTASAIFKYLVTCDDRPFKFNRSHLAHHIEEMGKKAGVKAYPHRFRHTFATEFLRAGGDPFTLQTILGHSTMEMVRRYITLAQVDIEAVHDRASPVTRWKL